MINVTMLFGMLVFSLLTKFEFDFCISVAGVYTF